MVKARRIVIGTMLAAAFLGGRGDIRRGDSDAVW